MRYFLVEFDGRSVPARMTAFDDVHEGLSALALAERNAPHGMEVVLLGADSEETLHRTHSRYFESWQEMLSRLGTELSDVIQRAPREPATL